MNNNSGMNFTPGGANITPGQPQGQPQGGQQFQLNVDPADLNSVECEKCKSKLFEQKTVLKQMSAIQSPTGKEGILPVNIIVCSNCLHPVKDFTKLLDK